MKNTQIYLLMALVLLLQGCEKPKPTENIKIEAMNNYATCSAFYGVLSSNKVIMDNLKDKDKNNINAMSIEMLTNGLIIAQDIYGKEQGATFITNEHAAERKRIISLFTSGDKETGDALYSKCAKIVNNMVQGMNKNKK